MTNFADMGKMPAIRNTGILTNPLAGHSKMSYLLALLLFVTPVGHTANSVNAYQNAQIGWQVSYPAQLSKIDEKKYAAMEQKGKDAIEGATNSQMTEDHKNLLLLEIDKRNIFTSSVSPYDPKLDGPYKHLQNEMFQSVVQAYQHRGLNFSHKLGEFEIDGLPFAIMTITIYGSDKKKILLIQEYYDRLLGGKDTFAMSITYNSRANQTLLRNIIDSSKFSIRN